MPAHSIYISFNINTHTEKWYTNVTVLRHFLFEYQLQSLTYSARFVLPLLPHQLRNARKLEHKILKIFVCFYVCWNNIEITKINKISYISIKNVFLNRNTDSFKNKNNCDQCVTVVIAHRKTRSTSSLFGQPRYSTDS